MAWKNLKQRSLAEAMLIDHDALKELDVAHELIDWVRLKQLLSGIHSKKQGEKVWPPFMIFKALFLQSKYLIIELMLLGLWNGVNVPPAPEWCKEGWFIVELSKYCSILERESFGKNRVVFICEIKQRALE